MSGWSNDDPLSVCQPTSTASAYPQALCLAWADKVVDYISRSKAEDPRRAPATPGAPDSMAEHDEAEVDSMDADTLPWASCQSEV